MRIGRLEIQFSWHKPWDFYRFHDASARAVGALHVLETVTFVWWKPQIEIDLIDAKERTYRLSTPLEKQALVSQALKDRIDEVIRQTTKPQKGEPP